MMLAKCLAWFMLIVGAALIAVFLVYKLIRCLIKYISRLSDRLRLKSGQGKKRARTENEQLWAEMLAKDCDNVYRLLTEKDATHKDRTEVPYDNYHNTGGNRAPSDQFYAMMRPNNSRLNDSYGDHRFINDPHMQGDRMDERRRYMDDNNGEWPEPWWRDMQ